MTAQLEGTTRLKQVFIKLQDLFVYAGTWYQSKLSYSPDTWQYYSATPLELGLYIQDKLEFEGMILNAGLRMDYFNPNKKGFATNFPLSDEFKNLYENIYQIPGW
jgi:hypothetical protein